MHHTLGSGSGLNGDGSSISALPAVLLGGLAESPGCCLFTTLRGSEVGIGDGGGNCSAIMWFSASPMDALWTRGFLGRLLIHATRCSLAEVSLAYRKARAGWVTWSFISWQWHRKCRLPCL